MKCRFCANDLKHTFIDLGSSPPSNSYLTDDALNEPERWYPLKVLICDNCWLAQTEDFVGFDELFSDDYAYFSSFSSSWLKHAQKYVEKVVDRFCLDERSMVAEVAANDGYLLQYVKQKHIPCYGIEPTHSTADAARERGIEIVEDFFGARLANDLVSEGKYADLIVANNVLAHVPHINDFVKGFSILLKATGVATFEFPHAQKQFDTIYHEHFSYLSLTSIARIFQANGLEVFDVDQLDVHGGSLRVYVQKSDSGPNSISANVERIMQTEINAGISTLSFYSGFQQKSEELKDDLLRFLLKCKDDGHSVAAYGAAAKGNTMLNFAGIKKDLVKFVVDKNPAKAGKFLPGSRIPIVTEDVLSSECPDYVLILPWNLSDEIMHQLSYVREWGAKFVKAVPELMII